MHRLLTNLISLWQGSPSANHSPLQAHKHTMKHNYTHYVTSCHCNVREMRWIYLNWLASGLQVRRALMFQQGSAVLDVWVSLQLAQPLVKICQKIHPHDRRVKRCSSTTTSQQTHSTFLIIKGWITHNVKANTTQTHLHTSTRLQVNSKHNTNSCNFSQVLCVSVCVRCHDSCSFDSVNLCRAHEENQSCQNTSHISLAS